ncbi:hypothetical protein ACH5RR_032110 [Cinchona calisaya]|uniref:Uncharacterized protein n=1 Tax=Cinchona calisaya TaxID=153742 RepID=A0ABD2YH61_9GENT
MKMLRRAAQFEECCGGICPWKCFSISDYEENKEGMHTDNMIDGSTEIIMNNSVAAVAHDNPFEILGTVDAPEASNIPTL